MEARFENKWGTTESNLTTHNIPTIIATQFVVIFIILVLIRPQIVMVKTSKIKVNQLSLIRSSLVTSIIVALTYLYPFIIKK